MELFPLFILMFLLFASGLLAGFVAGLLGVGAGLLTVPILYQGFSFFSVPENVQIHLAVGTAMGFTVTTAMRSAHAHWKKEAVDMSLVKIWAPTVFFGAFFGALLASSTPSLYLKLIIAVLTLVLAFRSMIVPADMRKTLRTPPLFIQQALGLIFGIISAMVAIGGGIFFVVCFTLFGISIHRAVGTSALLGFCIALPGTLGFILAGWSTSGLPLFSFGYVNLPALVILSAASFISAPFGARVAHRFSPRLLEWIFVSALVLVSAYMFYITFF